MKTFSITYWDLRLAWIINNQSAKCLVSWAARHACSTVVQSYRKSSVYSQIVHHVGMLFQVGGSCIEGATLSEADCYRLSSTPHWDQQCYADGKWRHGSGEGELSEWLHPATTFVRPDLPVWHPWLPAPASHCKDFGELEGDDDRCQVAGNGWTYWY